MICCLVHHSRFPLGFISALHIVLPLRFEGGLTKVRLNLVPTLRALALQGCNVEETLSLNDSFFLIKNQT